jgi:UDP-glucuronate decarboxylase
MIDGAVEFMRSPAEVIGPINFGNPSECTILDLARTIIRSQVHLRRLSISAVSQHDPKQRSRIYLTCEGRTRVAPRSAPEEGLKGTISYFQRSISG